MLRAILSVTDTRSCDSTPVPATNPRSSGRISVTGTPDGFWTPREVAQPASITELASTPARRKREVLFMVSDKMSKVSGTRELQVRDETSDGLGVFILLEVERLDPKPLGSKRARTALSAILESHLRSSCSTFVAPFTGQTF